MLEALIAALRREISGERALESVRALVGFHRVQASPGYDQATDWLAGELERAGLEVEIERVPGDGRTRCLGHLMPQGWACERAVAILHGDGPPRPLADYATQKLSLILRSAPARGRFAVVAIDQGTEASHYAGIEVRGRVVLTRGDVHRVHELAVVERGAAGLLSFGRRLVPPVRVERTDPDAVAYTSFWWGEHQRRGWGFAISPGEAARLRERLACGAEIELEVEIDSRAFDTTIPLVCASLPGNPVATGASTGEVLIVSHLCHPQPSANDNASGVAANLEAARALAVLRRAGELPLARRRIRHLWIPEFTGTYAWLAPRAQTISRVLTAALNLDMVGEDQVQCGSTFLLEHPPCFSASFAETLLEDIRQHSAEPVLSNLGPGHASLTRMAEAPYSGGSDHTAFLDPAIGVPCPMLIQWPDRFYHSSLDTPDRCDPRSLALAAQCAAVYAAFVAAAGVAECGLLAGRIARRARVRLLRALDHEDPARQIASERLRAGRALQSLERLWPGELDHSARESATRESHALEDFCEREIAPALARQSHTSDPVGVVSPRHPATGAGGEPAGGERVATRRIAAPLHYQRWLIEGWDRLPPEVRERWRAAETGPESLAGIFELAWSLCDGERDVTTIANLVWLESGRRENERLLEFLHWTATLDLSTWRNPKEI